jgi:hypothetical protein
MENYMQKKIKLVQIHFEDGTSEKIHSEGTDKISSNLLSAQIRQRIINQNTEVKEQTSQVFKNGKLKLSEKINQVRVTPSEKEFLRNATNICQVSESQLFRCIIQYMIVHSLGSNDIEGKDYNGIVRMLAPWLWDGSSDE